MNRPRIATAWLDGCSGCHMSLLDMDDALLDLAERVEFVYGPLLDTKECPDDVDVLLVEGCVGTDEQRELLQRLRANCRVLVSLGDCAVTGNVPAMRNPFRPGCVVRRAYEENGETNPQFPSPELPKLLPGVLPLHGVVKVDLFVPGCPPSAGLIEFVLNELIEGRLPDLAGHCVFGETVIRNP